MYARVYTGKQNQLHPLHPVSSSRRLLFTYWPARGQFVGRGTPACRLSTSFVVAAQLMRALFWVVSISSDQLSGK